MMSHLCHHTYINTYTHTNRQTDRQTDSSAVGPVHIDNAYIYMHRVTTGATDYRLPITRQPIMCPLEMGRLKQFDSKPTHNQNNKTHKLYSSPLRCSVTYCNTSRLSLTKLNVLSPLFSVLRRSSTRCSL